MGEFIGPVEFVIWSKFIVATAGCALAVGVLAVSAQMHRYRLAAIGLRIHVAGTRGKSATVRLIAANLRARGLCVVAKTTGSLPRIILPDGRDRIWRRWGAASIAEQVRLVRHAHRCKADVLVVECMAIQPDLIWAAQHRLIRAQISVVTNTHPDHFEELGSAPQAMAEALAETVPVGGRVFVTDQCFEPPFAAAAAARGCTIERLKAAGMAPLEANRRLATAVGEAIGGPAVKNAPEAATDPGAFRVIEVEDKGRRARIILAFACNDATSLGALWAAYGPRADQPVAFLFNGRSDRPLRSRALLQVLHGLRSDATVFLTGGGPLQRFARAAGFQRGRIVTLSGRTATDLLARAIERSAPGASIWGVGNFRGAGAAIAAAFPPPTAQPAAPC